MYALCIFGTYPLQCYVSLEIIWGNYLVRHIKDPKKECLIEYTLRTSVVVLTCKSVHFYHSFLLGLCYVEKKIQERPNDNLLGPRSPQLIIIIIF